jgi:hypothetical protein
MPTASAATHPSILTAAEAGTYLARRLGLPKPLSDQRTWALARARVLPCVRIGRQVRFRVPDLDKWLDRGGAGYPVNRRPD